MDKKKRISKSPEDRKQEILDAALELFAQKGYANTTIQDIAEYIGVSQGLCYRYFKSKSEMFASASEHYALSAVKTLNIPFKPDMTAIQKLNFLLREMYEYIIKSCEFDAIYFSEGQEKIISEVQLSRLKNFSAQLSSVLCNIIKQGINEHVMSCHYVETTSSFLTNGMIYTFHSNSPKDNFQEYASEFILSLRNLLINSLQMESVTETDHEWFETVIMNTEL